MNNPLVSIIVPVYNVQNSVARCLESICAQTWKNIEIILINDGSKDESLAVCESFRAKDPRVVLVDKENSGVSDTRNCGLTLAQGEYVQFVDSDDYIEPDFTERLVTAAEENHADLVISPYWMVIPYNSTKTGSTLENLQENLGIEPEKKPDEIHEYGFLPEGIYDRDTFARRLMDMPASFFYSVLWNKLYRRDLLMDNHLQFTSEVRWAEDLVFNLDYILCAKVFVSIPTPGYHYVQNAQSICHTQINPASIVQSCRCLITIKKCTQSLACTRRFSRSFAASCSRSPRAPTLPGPSRPCWQICPAAGRWAIRIRRKQQKKIEPQKEGAVAK